MTALTLPAAAGCEFQEDAPALHVEGFPTQYKIYCDDGRYGTGTIDSSGDVKADIYPSPVDRKHFQSRYYVGRSDGSHIYLDVVGPPEDDD